MLHIYTIRLINRVQIQNILLPIFMSIVYAYYHFTLLAWVENSIFSCILSLGKGSFRRKKSVRNFKPEGGGLTPFTIFFKNKIGHCHPYFLVKIGDRSGVDTLHLLLYCLLLNTVVLLFLYFYKLVNLCQNYSNQFFLNFLVWDNSYQTIY